MIGGVIDNVDLPREVRIENGEKIIVRSLKEKAPTVARK